MQQLALLPPPHVVLLWSPHCLPTCLPAGELSRTVRCVLCGPLCLLLCRNEDASLTRVLVPLSNLLTWVRCQAHCHTLPVFDYTPACLPVSLVGSCPAQRCASTSLLLWCRASWRQAL
jgi:hypothetical protein